MLKEVQGLLNADWKEYNTDFKFNIQIIAVFHHSRNPKEWKRRT